jgi:hypothetical protein
MTQVRTAFAGLILTLAVAGPVLAQKQEVRVAAAADLKFAMSDLARQYEQQTGNTLMLPTDRAAIFSPYCTTARQSTCFSPRASTIRENGKLQTWPKPGRSMSMRSGAS